MDKYWWFSIWKAKIKNLAQPTENETQRGGIYFFLGQISEYERPEKDLIMRQGDDGIWAHNTVLPQRNTGVNFYEIVVSQKIISTILEAAKTSPKPTG